MISLFQQAKLLALRVKMINGFMSDFGAGAHHDNYAFGIGRAHIVNQVIGAAYRLGELVHHRLDDLRASLVVRVGPLPHLEKHIGILRRTAQNGMIG